MRFPRMTVLLVALALLGCEHPGAPEHTASPPPPVENEASKATQQAALPPLPTPPPPRGPAAQPVDPNKLVGLSQEEVRRLIGPPSSTREEPPAVVWSYGSPGCGLDVSFYLDLATQTFRALAYDLKPKGAHGLQGSACLASLRPAP